MKPRDYIQRFCANPETYPHPYLHYPTRQGGKLYASDGHIVVMTEDDQSVSILSADNTLVNNAQKYIQGAFKAFPHMTPLRIELPPADACTLCCGAGRINTCTKCDGEGEVESSDKMGTRTCGACKGAGFHVKENGNRPCPICDGLKIKLDQTIPYGGSHYARRYLALLLELPGIHFTANPETPETGCAYFRFDGGYGALMPCRP